jgi:peroxidase
VDDVRNFLFGPPGAGGFDLASLNLQRGRDHGIPDINTVRSALGLLPYTSFLELTGGDADLAAAFASVYGTIDEVDLWIAGLAENEINGGLLGETFSAILVDQFTRTRDGDRFFYLNDLDHLLVLDPNLQNTTLSDVIRRNSSISNIQDNAFLAASVPEPTTIVGLVMFGFLGVVSRFRQRSR